MMVSGESSVVSEVLLLVMMTHNSQLTTQYYETFSWIFSLSERYIYF